MNFLHQVRDEAIRKHRHVRPNRNSQSSAAESLHEGESCAAWFPPAVFLHFPLLVWHFQLLKCIYYLA